MTEFEWVDTDGERRPLQPLWNDGERLYCRTWRNDAEGVQQALMAALPVAERPAPTVISRLTREFALKDYLDSDWAARPLALVQSRGRTLLLLENHSTATLDSLLGKPLELGRFLRLASAITYAIGRLHERGLVHKDIKPSNILLDPVSDEAWLTGFGIASRLPRERQVPEPPEFIAGTLAYMSPEQTGRMNRSIDSRSDLYALGVTFYQMLTGTLPFAATDPMEWVHCHIARTAMPPHERVGSIPALVSRIVLKLIAKTAEERYQTAAGLEHDLRKCHTEWEMRGRIDEFPLAAYDATDRLLIPEKLYGRSREVAALLGSFHQVVATGAPELILVSGYSGIGKSSVVNELHKALVPPRGLFASGKFDQFKRDIPYATVAQAFQSLVRQILSKNETELEVWRSTFREALGPNGPLIVDLIPELELVIGKQPPVPDLSPQDARRRFQSALRRFIGVFARPEHPLALFLDDLQWLDAATLDLFEDILAQRDIRHLLLIGAYRDNEVDAAHPLMRKLDAIRRTGASVQDIVLTPLTRDDLEQLISDSLRCETKPVNQLVQLVQEKTGGNPFFAIQFLHALADEALLVFDHADARWLCDLGRVRAKRYTDNVVDLMVVKLNRLPAKTQAPLRQLACVGASAAFAFLGTACQMSEEELHESLWEAVRSGLVHRFENSYAFQHDRIQEAAYSLVPEEARAEAHLRIGRLLVAHTPPGKREEIIFEIVGQFNRGTELITSEDERHQLAGLNLVAGKRAKGSTAYTSALTYLKAGAALLTEDSRERHRELMFALELNRAECEILTGQLSVADHRLAALSNRARTMVEQASVVCLHTDLYTLLDHSDRAVAVCLNYLRQVGIEWSPHPKEEEVLGEYERVRSLIGGRTIEVLIDSPLMQDPASLATIEVLIKLMPPALFTDANLTFLTSCKAVSLSLERGNCDASCFAYVTLGSQTGKRFGDYNTGFRFAKLGYDLVERRGLKRFEAGTSLRFAAVVAWMEHVRACRDPLRRAYETASRIGDLTIGAYACNRLVTVFLLAGEPLPEVQAEAERALAFVETAKFGLITDIVTAQLALTRMLRGLTPKFGCFDNGQFNELRIESHLSSSSALAVAAFCYWVRKLQARYLAGDYGVAMDAASKAQPLLWTTSFLLEEAEYHFYSALSQAASYELAAAHERQQHLDALAAHHRQLQIWAENCPENFENRAALVGAELARVEGRDLDAGRLYEQAVVSARANGFVHNEALACETAARFYRARGLEDIAEMYLLKARDGYLRWGADGKVRQLESLYPQLAVANARGGKSQTTSSDQQLDVAAVVKASQALSSEILLPRLIERLMTIAVQNAGADRGLLIRPARDEYLIQAEARATGDQIEVSIRQEPITGIACPESVVRYVIRTRESVILDDASKPNLFSADDYLRDRQSKSILCLPLIKQQQLIGILLLENTLASHTFTPARIAVLELLAAQAAISLENTRLYGDLQEREAKVRRLVDSNMIGILIGNLDGQVQEANEAFLQIIGYEQADVETGRLRREELTPPEWHDRDARAVAELATIGTAQPFEKEYFRKDGTRVPVLIGGARFDERGGIVLFVIDLTDRKQIETELRVKEERYRELFNSVPVALLEIDSQKRTEMLDDLHRQGVTDIVAYLDAHPDFERRAIDASIIREVNQQAIELFGVREADALIGVSTARLLALTPGALRRGTVSRFKGEKLFQHELKLQILDHTVDVLMTVARPEVSRNFLALTDITKLKTAEDALRRSELQYREAQTELAHANRVVTMGHLTASIAHEVSQPIAAMLTNAGTAERWLARQPPNLEKAKQLIGSIITDGKRAGDIISGIRDLVKKAPSRMGDLAINEMILEIIGLTRGDLWKNRVVVRTELAENLPLIQGDRVQLQQVILNLIVNAIEAMSQAEDGPRDMLISAKSESGNVLVTVRDSGPGLPQAGIERVFEAFYTTKPTGLGMGLSICRSIVETHGGRLWATPNEPRGAVFSMMLPIGETSLENLDSSYA
jgi:PAS domain S-box-containing protein